MHSVRLEPTKSILIGTRITYQATGDAGIHYKHNCQHPHNDRQIVYTRTSRDHDGHAHHILIVYHGRRSMLLRECSGSRA